jgi:predicted permease
MRRPGELVRFVLARLDRRRLDREMDDEMALHIALHEDALRRQGLSESEAHRRALAEFGGVERYREEARDARAFAWVYDLIADLRYGARALRRAPAFTFVAVTSLAVGLGANIAIFGVVYGTLVQQLPLPRAGELVALALSIDGDASVQFRRQYYLALRATPGVPDLEAVREADEIQVEAGNISGLSKIDYVEGGFFRLIGARPMLGRVITTADDRARDQVVVISDGVWERFFSRDPAAIGRQLLIKGQPFVVIGIMPRAYRGTMFNWQFGMAVPSSAADILGVPENRRYVEILARVDAGAERTLVAARLDATLHACCAANLRNPDKAHLSFVDASRGVPLTKMDFRDDYRLVLWLLMAGALLVLSIACSNVGSLLLARGAARDRELAVRLSIGASRGRVVRQLLAESALLAALGGVVGLALAAWATGLLIAVLPAGMESTAALVQFHVKPAVLEFSVAVSLACVFAFGLGPALRAARRDLLTSLKDGGRWSRQGRGGRVDRVLVIGQVAVTLVLVCGAGLLLATVRNLRAVDPGLATDHLLMVGLETRATAFEREGIVPIHQDILDRVRGVPGIRGAGMATRIPSVGGRNMSFAYSVVGKPRVDSAEVDLTAVTSGYFSTAGTRLIGGRDFDASDTPNGERVAIVNEAFVRKHFGTQSPIGAQVSIAELNGGETVAIVGVVQDVRFGDRRTRQDPMIYVPTTQSGKWPFFILMTRSSGPPRALIPAIERAIGPYARSLRVLRWQTMDESFNETILRERLAAGLSAACAALALGLAMVGLSGVVGFAVTRRTREIGVRMALGAQRSSVVWLVLRGALALVGIGVVIGVPLALGTGRTLGALLFGIGSKNMFVLGAAAAGLAIVSVIASAMPAWRASRVDPVTSLRAE